MAAQPPEPPRPQPAAGAHHPHLITHAQYEAMWEVYRDGTRTAGELVSRIGVNRETARRAVNQGWADRGWKALRERAKEHDQMRLDAERKAAIDKHREATDAWYRAGKQFNRVADNAVAFCMLAMQQVSQLATERDANGNLRLRQLTKHVRRRGRQPDGTVAYWDEEVPLTVGEAVRLAPAVLKAAESASEFKRLWPATDDGQKASLGPPMGLAALRDDQIDYIIEHHQLPPGVRYEDVFGDEEPPPFLKKGAKGTN